MHLPSRFVQNLTTQFPQVGANCRLLLAVSGGVDSVVLVHLVHGAGIPFSIAHMNFQLRGEESMRDEAFVRLLGEKYGCEVLVKRVDTERLAAERKMAIQELARELRYEWFAEIRRSWQERSYTVTAHHANDAIETMLMHLFRGTGLQGLTGIPAFNETQQVIRPLLCFRKKEILAFAAQEELSFVEDSSNAKDDYTRNFFRNSLLPLVTDRFPSAEDNLLHTMQHLQEVASIYETEVARQLKKLLEPRNGEWHVPVLKWKIATPLNTITWEIIRSFGFHAAQTGEVVKLLDASNGAYITSATHRIIRNRQWMIICPLADAAPQHILLEKDDTEAAFANALLRLQQQEPLPTSFGNDRNEAWIDADKITYPLLLRRWKQGDYFYPLGMQKKKKLSRFFIDQKLSKTAKENAWVLESDRRIVWVIGQRIDDRFKITPRTKKVLQLTVLNNA